ncbi:MAG: SURF1 family protein [Sphingomonas sp.]|uniref:SURF1 family protein n=1 Tax=Sphingomonas sp. TaxID=28214 RepID=UPI0025FEB1BE|nr:SURF1 family protein [Sphingomonas sp.]MBX3563633.1 SURF1 family protein [Sphingomonas sp.]
MKRALLVLFALAAALGFTALGIWQIERRAWKLDLIARVDAGLKAPPASDWRRFAEYRKVRLTGTYLRDRETLVKAVTERGEGFWVMTPLRTAQGVVLINRGFVSSPRQARWCGPDTEAAITGLQRATEPKGGFLRANDPANDRWYSRDVTAIATARQLGPVAPFFIDADATPNPGGYPVGGLTVVAFRNNHLVYALTWFALALLSAAGAVLALRRKRA